jgi:hypothetical protein
MLLDSEVDQLLAAFAEVDINGLPPDDVAWVGTWDLRACYHYGWLIKAGKVASDVDYDVDGSKYTQSQMAEHCLKQAALYSLTGTISLGTDVTAEVA